MQQPDGVRVHYLCHLINQLAWERFVVDQKDKAGITNKVGCVFVCMHACICVCVCLCVWCMQTTTSSYITLDLFNVLGLCKVPEESRSHTNDI